MNFTCPKCGNRDEFYVVYENGGEIVGERLAVTCCDCGFSGFEDVEDDPARVAQRAAQDVEIRKVFEEAYGPGSVSRGSWLSRVFR